MSMVRIQARDPPPLSEADRKTLAGLAALPDVATDCSNVPPLDDTFWQNAVPAQAREHLQQHREQAHGHIALTIPLPPSPAAGTPFASAAKTASTSSMKRRKAGWSATRSRFHAMRTDEKGRRNAGLLLWWCYCPYNAVSCPLASTLPFRLKPSTAGVASAGRSRLLSSA